MAVKLRFELDAYIQFYINLMHIIIIIIIIIIFHKSEISAHRGAGV
jgi:hypothetical protein